MIPDPWLQPSRTTRFAWCQCQTALPGAQFWLVIDWGYAATPKKRWWVGDEPVNWIWASKNGVWTCYQRLGGEVKQHWHDQWGSRNLVNKDPKDRMIINGLRNLAFFSSADNFRRVQMQRMRRRRIMRMRLRRRQRKRRILWLPNMMFYDVLWFHIMYAMFIIFSKDTKCFLMVSLPIIVRCYSPNQQLAVVKIENSQLPLEGATPQIAKLVYD